MKTVYCSTWMLSNTKTCPDCKKCTSHTATAVDPQCSGGCELCEKCKICYQTSLRSKWTVLPQNNAQQLVLAMKEIISNAETVV